MKTFGPRFHHGSVQLMSAPPGQRRLNAISFVCFLWSHNFTKNCWAGFFIIVLEPGGQGSSNFFFISFLHIVMAVLHSFSFKV